MAGAKRARLLRLIVLCVLAGILVTGLYYFWWGRRATPPDVPSPAFRAFNAVSYWNTPMPATAPVDPQSNVWIADSLDGANTQPFLRLPALREAGGGVPIYDASATDPVHRICANIKATCFDIHIPAEAAPANTRDSILQVWDRSTDQVLGMHKATRNADGTFSHEGIDRWFLSSEGLDEKLPNSTPGNFGHRGLPAPVRVVRLDEVLAGKIQHRLSCFWHATSEQVYWPMVQYETGKTGIVPEGVVIRIKPSVNLSAKPLTPGALVIARALKDYGCTIGDNSGSGNTLALEQADWSSLLGGPDALSSIPFNEWEFIKAGYNPSTKTRRPR
jgi:hypothetical protein